MMQFRDKSNGFLLPLYMTDGTASGTGFVNSELRMTYSESAIGRPPSTGYNYQGRNARCAGQYRSRPGRSRRNLADATVDNPAPGLELATLNGRLYFMNGRCNDPVHGNEVWSTDGTPIGMQLLADIAPGTEDTQAYLKVVGGRLDLSVFDGRASYDPWSTDGAASPVPLARLGLSVDTGDSSPTMLGTAGARVLFAADDGVNGTELWATDGTSTGTRRLTDVPGGNGIDAGSGFVQMDGFGLFVGTGATGAELWRSDGTPAGTALVADIASGAAGSSPRLFNAVVVDEVAYFIASDHVHGLEVWRSDGTSAGTAMLFDGVPGAADGASQLFQATRMAAS